MNQNKLIENLMMALISIRESSHNASTLQELQTAIEGITDSAFNNIVEVNHE